MVLYVYFSVVSSIHIPFVFVDGFVPSLDQLNSGGNFLIP